jgi:hypothetical protein
MSDKTSYNWHPTKTGAHGEAPLRLIDDGGIIR